MTITKPHTNKMRPGKYRIHVNAEGIDPDGGSVKVSVDIVIKPKSSRPGALPILMEMQISRRLHQREQAAQGRS